MRLERRVCSCLTLPLCPSPPVLLAPRCLFPLPPIQSGPQCLFMYLPLFVPKYMFPLNQHAFHCFPFAPKCPFSLTQFALHYTPFAPLPHINSGRNVCVPTPFAPKCLFSLESNCAPLFHICAKNVCFPILSLRSILPHLCQNVCSLESICAPLFRILRQKCLFPHTQFELRFTPFVPKCLFSLEWNCAPLFHICAQNVCFPILSLSSVLPHLCQNICFPLRSTVPHLRQKCLFPHTQFELHFTPFAPKCYPLNWSICAPLSVSGCFSVVFCATMLCSRHIIKTVETSHRGRWQHLRIIPDFFFFFFFKRPFQPV